MTKITVTRPDGREVVATVRLITDAEIMADALAEQLPDWSFLAIVYPDDRRADRLVIGKVQGIMPPEPTLLTTDAPLLDVYAAATNAWLTAECDRVRLTFRETPNAYRACLYAALLREIARRE